MEMLADESGSEGGGHSPQHHSVIDNEQLRGEKVSGIDRERSCPMYVRLFCRMNGHHRPEEFGREKVPIEDEVTVYTWKDANLSELASLIKEVNVECRRRDANFSFQLVYQDMKGRFHSKPIGIVSNSRSGRNDNITLEALRFVQGDFIDVAITFGTGTMQAHRRSSVPERGHYEHREHNREPRNQRQSRDRRGQRDYNSQRDYNRRPYDRDRH
jgi:histone deacetylase complex subunit SAP18